MAGYGTPLGVQTGDARHEVEEVTKKPKGGVTVAPGLRINWAETRLETALETVLDRARFLQEQTSERCDEYEAAIAKLEEAQGYLTRRLQNALATQAAPGSPPNP